MWTRDSITWLNVSFIVNFHATEQRSYVSKLILLFIELVCDHVTKATDHNLISASIQYNCGHVTRNTIWRNLSPSLFISENNCDRVFLWIMLYQRQYFYNSIMITWSHRSSIQENLDCIVMQNGASETKEAFWNFQHIIFFYQIYVWVFFFFLRWIN